METRGWWVMLNNNPKDDKLGKSTDRRKSLSLMPCIWYAKNMWKTNGCAKWKKDHMKSSLMLPCQIQQQQKKDPFFLFFFSFHPTIHSSSPPSTHLSAVIPLSSPTTSNHLSTYFFFPSCPSRYVLKRGGEYRHNTAVFTLSLFCTVRVRMYIGKLVAFHTYIHRTYVQDKVPSMYGDMSRRAMFSPGWAINQTRSPPAQE